jgi:hypothetical protein
LEALKTAKRSALYLKPFYPPLICKSAVERSIQFDFCSSQLHLRWKRVKLNATVDRKMRNLETIGRSQKNEEFENEFLKSCFFAAKLDPCTKNKGHLLLPRTATKFMN